MQRKTHLRHKGTLRTIGIPELCVMVFKINIFNQGVGLLRDGIDKYTYVLKEVNLVKESRGYVYGD